MPNDAEKAFNNCLLILEGTAVPNGVLDGLCFLNESNRFYSLFFRVCWERAHYENLHDDDARFETCRKLVVAECWRMLGDLHEKQEHPLKAALAWQTALTYRPGVPPLEGKLAIALHKLGREDERINRIENVTNAFWNDADARIALVREKLARGDSDVGPIFTETLNIFRSFPEHAHHLQTLLSEFKDLHDAVAPSSLFQN